MQSFTLSLALFNFLPVVFTALAMVFIVRLLHTYRTDILPFAIAAAILIVAGGLAKACWKLIFTLTGTDILWLSNALFPLIGPGFFMLAVLGVASLYQQRSQNHIPRPWLWAFLCIAAFFALAAWRSWGLDIPRGWFLPIMTLTTLGNLGLSIVLIVMAFMQRQRGIAILFILNIVMIFALQPIAMTEPKTVSLHWVEQILTALGTLCFSVASYLLLRLTQTSRHSTII